MEKSLTNTIYTVDIFEGYTKANLDRLSQVMLQNSSEQLHADPSHTRFEDTFCPDSAIITKIVDDMQGVYSKHTKSSESLVLEEHWGHIHFSNMSTNMHDHRGADFSAVTYLSVPPGCGSIVFWPNPLDDYRYIIPPKKGMFLLFPGWIPHSVSRNLSSEPRVSLSFNFKLNSGEA